jgi:N-acetylmuramic acid 6-phosphate etherase
MTDRRTEARHPAADGLQDAAPDDVLARLLAAQLAAAEVVRAAFPAIAAAAALGAGALGSGHRLIYAGAGSSGLMALSDCLELAGTFGIPPDRTPMLFAGGTAALLHMTGGSEDDRALAVADLTAVRPGPGDAVICVSASGGTPYTVEIARAARAAGAKVISVANVSNSALLAQADVEILLDTGPEVVAGSTRMGAGTAQKIALNMLSVLIGLQLGHVHAGYMVNVVADNAKLLDRAARIVAALSGADRGAAEAALSRTGGAVKPAVLVAAGATPEAAMAALDTHRGHLGPALAEVTG